MPWYETEPFSAFWEKSYRDPTLSSMGGPSFEVAEIASALPKGATVLDLGCGEGRNSFFLAQLGCHVTAVDRSKAGIDKLSSLSEKFHLNIKTHVADIATFKIDTSYDLVMAHGVLYYLENKVWRNLLDRVKAATRPAGFNIFTVFIYNESVPCSQEIAAAQYLGSFAPNEIQEFYSDWIELRFDQYTKWDSHPGVPLHAHPIEKLVVQKPLQNFSRRKIESGEDLPPAVFEKITIGMSQSELLQLARRPGWIEAIPFSGPQMGSENLIDKTYQMSLWYYGKCMIYLVNGRVTGKSLLSTPPVHL
jgi:tellurite methyltransferase